MDGPAPSKLCRRPPGGLLGMLALVAVVEVLLAGRDRFSTDAALCWRETGRAARREAAGCDLLCFGDSMVKFGVLPRVLESRLGGRGFNLALHAGPPSASYVLLRRAIEQGAHPKVLLADFMPHHLAARPFDPALYRPWTELLAPRDLLELARNMGETDVFVQLALAKLLPSYRARHEIRSEVLGLIRGRSWNLNLWFQILARNWRVNRGSQPLDLAATPSRIEGENNGLFPASWTCDPPSLAYVRRFLRLAEDRGATVFWLLPPIHPDAQARRERMGLDAAYELVVRLALDRYPSLIVLDARHAGFGAERFRDEVHLDARGAVALSTALASVMVPGPTGPRWRVVPPYREPAPTGLVENVEESRLALLRERAGHRARR